MKKLLCLFILCALLLSGCQKKADHLASKDDFKITEGKTAAGIQVGDEKDAFIHAYKEYPIQVAYNNIQSSYMVMSIKKIPYTENISTMIANFFVDGEPVSESDLCKEYEIDPSELYEMLSSPDYLRSHDVRYRYLRFRWQDGKIAHIESDELNYNETFETPHIK